MKGLPSLEEPGEVRSDGHQLLRIFRHLSEAEVHLHAEGSTADLCVPQFLYVETGLRMNNVGGGHVL